jgi:outer membrane lipoprotein SlyB
MCEASCVCGGGGGEEVANSFGTINGLGLGFGVKHLLAKMSNVSLKLDRVCCKE